MRVQKLNFPTADFRFKNSENKLLIFDLIRKKFVVLQPEEWVRQHCIHFLIDHLNCPQSLINVEKKIKLGAVDKRYDIVVYNPDGSIYLIVECKSFNIKIDQAVFDQIARYNIALNAQYLMVTNGLNHYYCEIDFIKKSYRFLEEIPKFRL